MPITIPSGVEVTLDGTRVAVKGPKGELERHVSPELRVVQDDGTLRVERPNDDKRSRELHGLTRTLLVIGPLDAQPAVLVHHAQLGRHVALELALGAADRDVVAVDVDLDAGGKGNGELTDA